MQRYNPDIHHRRSIRLRDYDYSQDGLYFISICIKTRECLFGEIVDDEMILNKNGEIVEKCWLDITQHYPDTVLHEFVVMPNHLHGIVEITAPVGAQNFVPLQTPTDRNAPPLPRRNEFQKIIPRSIGAIVRGFKIGTTKQLGYSVWQRNYYEHIIRDGNSYQIISDYILNNPKKWQTDKFYTNI